MTPCHGALGKETFVKARVNGEVAPQPIVRRTRGAGAAPAESGHLAALRCCPDQQPVVAVSITVLSARRSGPIWSANERDARQHVSQSRAAYSRSATSACRVQSRAGQSATESE